ncbi:MAG: ester cyclase [Clostridium sp.]
MTEKDIVYKFFKEGYENKNYDFVMEYVSENYIDHSPAGARSNADAVNILKIVEGQFSDLKIEVLDLFSENDMIATRILYNGIHTGTCMGIPATGKRINFEALENFKVVNGKIVESWGYWPDKEIEHKLLEAKEDLE